MKTTMFLFIALLWTCTLCVGQGPGGTSTVGNSPLWQGHSVEGFKNANFRTEVIPVPGKTWGYDIFLDQKLMIHQPSIPGMLGNQGFRLRSDAENVAKLVISRMKAGIMPPTVTPQDLAALHISIN